MNFKPHHDRIIHFVVHARMDLFRNRLKHYRQLHDPEYSLHHGQSIGSVIVRTEFELKTATDETLEFIRDFRAGCREIAFDDVYLGMAIEKVIMDQIDELRAYSFLDERPGMLHHYHLRNAMAAYDLLYEWYTMSKPADINLFPAFRYYLNN